MYCPQCATQNLPTDLRCLQCGTSLVRETVGGSDNLRKASAELDTRMYGGLGGLFGFVMTFIFCNAFLSGLRMTDRALYGSAVVGAMVFGALGRYIARKRL